MLLSPWFRAGNRCLNHKLVKHFMVLNDLCTQWCKSWPFNLQRATAKNASLFKLLRKSLGVTLPSYIHGNQIWQNSTAPKGVQPKAQPFSCTESLQASLELSLWFNTENSLSVLYLLSSGISIEWPWVRHQTLPSISMCHNMRKQAQIV